MEKRGVGYNNKDIINNSNYLRSRGDGGGSRGAIEYAIKDFIKMVGSYCRYGGSIIFDNNTLFYEGVSIVA